jgi:hypothetical protein
MAMVLPRRLGLGVMLLLSRAGDDAAKSCWQWCCRNNLCFARHCCRVMLATAVPSHAGDGAAVATWAWHDVVALSSWRWHHQAMLAMAPPR